VIPLFEDLDLSSPGVVIALFDRAADASLTAHCRRGSIDVISATEPGPARLIATGDIHDNTVALAKLATLAGMTATGMTAAGNPPTAHLTLHEIIHSDRLSNGMDFSYRALARAAVLKAAFPEHVHTLLANHELAQVVGAGITKDGINVVAAFNAGVEYIFGDETSAVTAAINRFIYAMPLALRCTSSAAALDVASGGDLLCAHSLPGPLAMDRFDVTLLERATTDADFIPRQGSAHMLVWGRHQRPADLDLLAKRWGASLFILGHEKAPTGAMLLCDHAVILNTDHDQARYLDIDLTNPPTAAQAVERAQLLADIELA